MKDYWDIGIEELIFAIIKLAKEDFIEWSLNYPTWKAQAKKWRGIIKHEREYLKDLKEIGANEEAIKEQEEIVYRTKVTLMNVRKKVIHYNPKDVYNFIRSDWCFQLTNIDNEVLLDIFEKQLEEERVKINEAKSL